MPPCPACQQPASKRNGQDRRGRQKYTCRPCRCTFTEHTASAFSGYRWPADHRKVGFREGGTSCRRRKLDGQWRDGVLVERLLGEAAEV